MSRQHTGFWGCSREPLRPGSWVPGLPRAEEGLGPSMRFTWGPSSVPLVGPGEADVWYVNAFGKDGPSGQFLRLPALVSTQLGLRDGQKLAASPRPAKDHRPQGPRGQLPRTGAPGVAGQMGAWGPGPTASPCRDREGTVLPPTAFQDCALHRAQMPPGGPAALDRLVPSGNTLAPRAPGCTDFRECCIQPASPDLQGARSLTCQHFVPLRLRGAFCSWGQKMASLRLSAPKPACNAVMGRGAPSMALLRLRAVLGPAKMKLHTVVCLVGHHL